MASTPRNNKVHIRGLPAAVTPVRSKVDGPFYFFNPTHIPFYAAKHSPSSKTADLHATPSRPEQQQQQQQQQQQHHHHHEKALPKGVHFLWRSRDNRKGRHAIVIFDTDIPSTTKAPKPTSAPREVLKNIWRMAVDLNYWDVSWWVATLFTWGSVVWCINGFFVWLPLVAPSTEFDTEVDAGGITAFIGATIFELGSVMLMFEAVNEKRSACFGWALEKAFESDSEGGDRERIVVAKCGHRHPKGARKGGRITSSDSSDSDSETIQWQWWPSWHDLKTHYLHQLGFLACAIQFFAATIFWISGFTALPSVIDMENKGLSAGVFWTPQVVGGTGFIVSGFLFMLETQTKWWKPEPLTLGWHVGFWNFIGGVGFTLCGALGYAGSNTGVAYQSALATFWGGWAFLIGSLFQWYEAVQKHPVEMPKSS